MVTETHSCISGRKARVWLKSDTTKSPTTIEQVIEFLRYVSEGYPAISLEELSLEKEEHFSEYSISCQILIPARKEDWDRQEKNAQEEKDRRLAKYIELKKEFEK